MEYEEKINEEIKEMKAKIDKETDIEKLTAMQQSLININTNLSELWYNCGLIPDYVFFDLTNNTDELFKHIHNRKMDLWGIPIHM